MLILIDHANVDSIAKTLEYLPIDGVTTNPTILYREGKEPLEVLHAIKQLLPDGASAARPDRLPARRRHGRRGPRPARRNRRQPLHQAPRHA